MLAFFTGFQGEKEPDFGQRSNSSKETAASISIPLLPVLSRPIDASMSNAHLRNSLRTFRKCNSRNIQLSAKEMQDLDLARDGLEKIARVAAVGKARDEHRIGQTQLGFGVAFEALNRVVAIQGQKP